MQTGYRLCFTDFFFFFISFMFLHMFYFSELMGYIFGDFLFIFLVMLICMYDFNFVSLCILTLNFVYLPLNQWLNKTVWKSYNNLTRRYILHSFIVGKKKCSLQGLIDYGLKLNKRWFYFKIVCIFHKIGLLNLRIQNTNYVLHYFL